MIPHRSQVVAHFGEELELDGKEENEANEKSSDSSSQSKALDQL